MVSRSSFTLLLCGYLTCLAAPTLAGTHDHVHADSFGNLIVIAPSGYKRIIVGQGHQAAELQGYTGSNVGGALDLGPEPFADEALMESCPAILVKGRSYMYGFDEGVIPLSSKRCR